MISLLEANMLYFFYVCFLNMRQMFVFVFLDKIWGVFMVLVMFCLVVFCCCFYVLVADGLGKNAHHFC